MKLNKYLVLSALLTGMGFTNLHAQQSANAAGGDASGSGGTASYSIGQVVYTMASGSNGTSNQGVQQPYEFFTVGIDNLPSVSLVMSVFPNPTQSTVNLKVESPSFDNLSFELYDVSGQLITSQRVSNALTAVPMQGLASGAYLLRVLDSQKPAKTFNIIKAN